MNASFGAVDLGSDAVWSNEFAGSAIDITTKYTEDGRKFVFQKPKQQHREDMTLDFQESWLDYATVKALEVLKNTGTVETLTLVDGRVFNALLVNIDAKPIIDYAEPDDDDLYAVTLTFMEV